MRHFENFSNNVTKCFFITAANNQMRRQSTTEEILIARGFRRESTTEDILRCRNFRRQSVQYEPIVPRRGRRDSCTQITDGTVGSMVIESDKAICDAFVQTGIIPIEYLAAKCIFDGPMEIGHYKLPQKAILITLLFKNFSLEF